MNLFALLAAACAGIALAAQSPTNTSLSKIVGGFLSSTISFFVGLLCMIVLVVVAGDGTLYRIVEVSPWQLLGGVYGSFVVFSTIVATPHLGVALTMTASMLGQLTMSICIDAFGWFQVAPTAIGAERIFGCALVACGIALTYFGNKFNGVRAAKRDGARGANPGGARGANPGGARSANPGGARSANPGGARKSSLGFVLMMVLSGTLTAMQAPTNVSLSNLVGSLEATMVSFAVGLIVVAALAFVTSRGKKMSLKGARGWQFLGGLYGAVYVGLSIVATSELGVNLTMATIMLGQILGGMAIDSFGLFQTTRIKMNAYRIGGLLAIVAGVLTISSLWAVML